ncbi:MAG: ribonuclease E/G, partial [Bacteroidota bacterium]
SRKLYKEITSYLKTSSPNLLQKVELYNGDKPIFEEYGVEKELAKTYKRRVPLSSGGDIVIEHTEAMVVIDVNSGRSTEKEQEMNAYKTNLEAAREVAKQIRLRDIAGMVIVDFIDMQHESNRKKLYSEMKKELSRDRAKTVIFPLTQIGLMQLTRQRINQNIVEKISEICPTCSGTGRITTKAVLLNNIERWLKKFRKESREFRLILQVHPQVADYITEGTFSHIAKLMLKYFVKINVQQNDGVGIDQFRFISERRNKDITNEHI